MTNENQGGELASSEPQAIKPANSQSAHDYYMERWSSYGENALDGRTLIEKTSVGGGTITIQLMMETSYSQEGFRGRAFQQYINEQARILPEMVGALAMLIKIEKADVRGPHPRGSMALHGATGIGVGTRPEMPEYVEDEAGKALAIRHRATLTIKDVRDWDGKPSTDVEEKILSYLDAQGLVPLAVFYEKMEKPAEITPIRQRLQEKLGLAVEGKEEPKKKRTKKKTSAETPAETTYTTDPQDFSTMRSNDNEAGFSFTRYAQRNGGEIER